jgi:hypothetical protein
VVFGVARRTIGAVVAEVDEVGDSAGDADGGTRRRGVPRAPSPLCEADHLRARDRQTPKRTLSKIELRKLVLSAKLSYRRRSQSLTKRIGAEVRADKQKEMPRPPLRHEKLELHREWLGPI